MNTKILFSEQQIQDAVKTVAFDLNTTTEYWGENNVFVGVLTGGFMFYTDLVKQISFPIECDFVRTKSYVTNQAQVKPVVIKEKVLSLRIDLENYILLCMLKIIVGYVDMGWTIMVYIETHPTFL